MGTGYLQAIIFVTLSQAAFSQVDTTLIYNPNTSFGTLDTRLSKGNGHNYYLEEDKTFSFRENSQGPTNSYLKMTAWDSSPYTQGNMRQKNESNDEFVMNYRLLIPQKYEPAFSPGYPLVIVMHGLLERGNCANEDCYHSNKEFTPNENDPPAPTAPDHMLLNNDYNLVHAGLDFLEAHNINGSTLPNDPALPSAAFPGFVLFPQNLNGWDPSSSQDVIRLIRLLTKKYNIDQERIYINGISHGGHGGYEVLKRAPWMFAAAVMFSAADDASLISQKMTDDIATTPLWIFQGALDANPSQGKTESYIKAFRKAGANVRYTLYPHLGHGTWNEALDEPDFFSWLLSKKRNSIHVNGGDASICATSNEGTPLTLPKGFKAYEWEYNGALIATSGNNTYVAQQPGTYRGRFLMFEANSQGRWSTWTDTLHVTESVQAIPPVKQIGTLLLPDLNGNPDAQLRAEGNFTYYYWYKDGKPVKGSGINDTIKSITIKPHLGNGAYNVRVAGYDRCKSPPSNALNIVFNNEAPISLPAPVDFQAKAISPSQVSLTWSDISQSENGFEIWRKSKNADGTFSPWLMSVITKAETTSYTDNGLSPATAYYYRIRAVNNSSRSQYSPEAEQDVIVDTPGDTEIPSPPGDLYAVQAGVNAIRLSWLPSVDNSSILEYIILNAEDSLNTNAADTTFLLKDLEVNNDYSFRVRAVDRSGNVSQASNTAQANTFLKGLYYEHSTGSWNNINMIDWSIAEFSGTVPDFTLAPKTQEDFFNFLFDGFLNVEKEGVYQFRLTSDDGSVLNLNDSLLIANDGIHNINTVTSPVTILNAGPQRITLKYFDYVLSDTLLVEYKGPDSNGEWVRIPSEALASTRVTSTEAEVVNEFDFSVYPNPVTDNNMRIQLHTKLNDPVSILIINPAGGIVYENIMDNHKSEFEIVPPFQLKAGLFIISVRQGLRLINKKIIIQR